MRGRKSRHLLAAAFGVVTLLLVVAVIATRTDVAQAQASVLSINVMADGVERQVRTAQTTVGATLTEAGIELGPADRVHPNTDMRLRDGMTVQVVRVVEKVILQKEPIAFNTRRKPTSELRAGLTKVVSEGERGLKHLYYKVRVEDGVVRDRELLRAEVVQDPKDREILMGDRGAGVSRGFFASRQTLRMNATAYDPGPISCGKYADGKTATGMKAGFGVVAVDPKVIPLGSRLYVEGYGFAIAGDVGGSIKGNRIDLGFDTYRAAIRFGRKMVTVHVLE